MQDVTQPKKCFHLESIEKSQKRKYYFLFASSQENDRLNVRRSFIVYVMLRFYVSNI